MNYLNYAKKYFIELKYVNGKNFIHFLIKIEKLFLRKEKLNMNILSFVLNQKNLN